MASRNVLVLRYDIWFGGEPPPTVTWEREGTVIQPEPRITLELFSKKTVYCERNTVGLIAHFFYVIHLNSEGSHRAES